MQRQAIEVANLADHADLLVQVGELRWREWGDGAISPERWTRITARESGTDRLPITLVAIDASGSAVGAVALGKFDDALAEWERADRSPWLLGMVVQTQHRNLGIGKRLVTATEALARTHSYTHIWVATGADAVDFYQHCGWSVEQQLTLAKGGLPTCVLSKSL